MSRHLADSRHPHGTGLDHRSRCPQPAARIADSHARGDTQGSGGKLGFDGVREISSSRECDFAPYAPTATTFSVANASGISTEAGRTAGATDSLFAVAAFLARFGIASGRVPPFGRTRLAPTGIFA